MLKKVSKWAVKKVTKDTNKIDIDALKDYKKSVDGLIEDVSSKKFKRSLLMISGTSAACLGVLVGKYVLNEMNKEADEVIENEENTDIVKDKINETNESEEIKNELNS